MPLSRPSRSDLRARFDAEEALSAQLSALVGSPMRVALTRNRKRLLSVRRNPRGQRELRIHAALAAASTAEIDVLAAWVLDKPGSHVAARTLLARYGAEIDRVAALRVQEPTSSHSVGRHHDLLVMLHDLKAQFFPEIPPVYIAWSGRLGPARRRRLGSWTSRGRLVRIHCLLDSADVPDYFVASVIHHELCHAALEPGRTPTGRRRLHGAEFRRLEAMFPDLAAAQEWERSNVARLLR
jgi:hypothetical protein